MFTLQPRDNDPEDFLQYIQSPFTYTVAQCFAVPLCLLRPHNKTIYAPRLKHISDGKRVPPAISNGVFGWVQPVVKTRDQALVEKIGQDAIVFLQFTTMCRNITIFLSIIGCGVYIPLNIVENKLPELIETYEGAVRALEAVLSKYSRHPRTLPAKRPTCKARAGDDTSFAPGANVDAIEYLVARIRRLSAKIHEMRNATVADLSKLGAIWPTFQAELERHPRTWGAIQGILAPLVTTLFYLLLPTIFRRLSIYAGDLSKTEREREVCRKLYVFFIFNNRIVFSFFSAGWKYAAAVIRAQSNQNLWAAIKDTQPFENLRGFCDVSPFWLNYLLQRNLGSALDVSQLVKLGRDWLSRRLLNLTPGIARTHGAASFRLRIPL
ncbi:hypothetical protein PG995_005374 [Apiospora arundinis]